MPTYEYQCTKCDHTFEEFKPMNAPRRQRCPLCRGKVERLISGGSGVVFKGDGFYVNDSRRRREPEKTATESKSEPAAQSGGETAAEAAKKPATTDKPKRPGKASDGKRDGGSAT